MQRGINKIIAGIRPTLGPTGGVVAVEQVLKDKLPEMLDNGATIARRVVELPHRDEDVGAMYVREFLWNVQEQVGDGTATAAVLFQKIYNEGLRYQAAGGNTMRLRKFLEEGMRVILDELDGMTLQVEGKEQLAQVAETVCHDAELAAMLGEVYDIIGAYGRLELRKGRTHSIRREYLEGIYWEKGLLSRRMILDGDDAMVKLENPAILITDLAVEDPRELLPAITAAAKGGAKSLVLVVEKLSEVAIGMLLSNKDPNKFRVVAVQTPGTGKQAQIAALQDMAILTGGRAITKDAGGKISAVKFEDFGHARRITANMRVFRIMGGKGDARKLRSHVAALREGYQNVADLEAREQLRVRISKLLGGTATIWVGGPSEYFIEQRKELAEHTAAAVRGALMEGVLPGGGVALYNCKAALENIARTEADVDRRAAYRMLSQALEEPIRTIIRNAGFDDSEKLAEVQLHEPGYGFDVFAEQATDMATAGIVDVTSAIRAAAFYAISSAALALTVDVLVHRGRRQEQPVIKTSGMRKKI